MICQKGVLSLAHPVSIEDAACTDSQTKIYILMILECLQTTTAVANNSFQLTVVDDLSAADAFELLGNN